MTRTLRVGAAQLGPVAARPHPQGGGRAAARPAPPGRRGRLPSWSCSPSWRSPRSSPAGSSTTSREVDALLRERDARTPTPSRCSTRPPRLGVGFCLGYAELDRRRAPLQHADPRRARRAHRRPLPQGPHPRPRGRTSRGRPFQHLERHYFEPGPDGFGVWRAFGGLGRDDDLQRPALARDLPGAGPAGRRADPVRLQHADPLRARPEPGHPRRVPQRARDAGRARTRTARGWSAWPRAASRRASTRWPRVVHHRPDRARSSPRRSTDRRRADRGRCDLDWCQRYKGTLFDFDRYRRPELYGRITDPAGRHRTAGGPEALTSMTSTELDDADTVDVRAQRHAGRRAGRPPAPARRAARGARHHLAQGRLLAVGPVRLLHRALDGKAVVSLPAAARQGRRASRSSRSKASTPTSGSASPTPSPPAAACSAGSASPAS